MRSGWILVWLQWKEEEYKNRRSLVTFVGYGHDGKQDSEVLIIHDPETRWRHNDYIRVEKISEDADWKWKSAAKRLRIQLFSFRL